MYSSASERFRILPFRLIYPCWGSLCTMNCLSGKILSCFSSFEWSCPNRAQDISSSALILCPSDAIRSTPFFADSASSREICPKLLPFFLNPNTHKNTSTATGNKASIYETPLNLHDTNTTIIPSADGFTNNNLFVAIVRVIVPERGTPQITRVCDRLSSSSSHTSARLRSQGGGQEFHWKRSCR